MKKILFILFLFLFYGTAIGQKKVSEFRFRICDFTSHFWVTESTESFEVFLVDPKNKTRVDSLRYGTQQFYRDYQYFWLVKLPADSKIMALIIVRKTTNDTMTFYYKAKEGMNFIDMIRFMPGYWKTDYRYELTEYDPGKIIYQLIFASSEKNYWENDSLNKCDCREGLDWRNDNLGKKYAYVEGTDSLFTGICWEGNVAMEYNKGLPNGNSIEYYPSGKIKLKATNDGNRTAYYESGKIRAVYKNAAGAEFYENGQIKGPVIIKQNKKCIKYVVYYDTGKRKSQSKNRNKFHGRIDWRHDKIWNEKGKKTSNIFERSRTWQNGKTIWGRTITLTLRKDGKLKFNLKVEKGGRNIFP